MNKKDDNLIIRPLVTADVEQYNALLRYSFQVTEQELSETGWKDDEIKQSKFPVIERADVLGCFSGDDLVAQFASYPLDMNIYGAKYAVGFVTSGHAVDSSAIIMMFGCSLNSAVFSFWRDATASRFS